MKKLLLSLILAGSFAADVRAVVFEEWSLSVGGNGHFYTVIGETPDLVLSYPDAQAEAEALGGYLVTLESAAELNFVRNAFGGTELFWTGMNTDGGSGSFQWANGEPVVYSYFGGFTPDPFVNSAVVINQVGSRGFTKGYFGTVDPFANEYRAIVEFDTGEAPNFPVDGVPDAGNPLLLVLLSGVAGMLCRVLKR